MSENQVIADLAEQAADPWEVATGRDPQGSPDLLAWVLRSDQRLESVDLEPYAAVPSRKKGTVTLRTAESFCGYVARHRDPVTTTLWSSVERDQVIAVLDDHAEGADIAGWADHRAQLRLQATRDWAHWTSRDGHMSSQEVFAEHLEDGADCVVSPDAATMLEIAQSFHAKRGVNFRSGCRLASGEVQFLYEETITSKAGQRGELSVPDVFQLAVAPYEGSLVHPVFARFRYRLVDGSLKLGYRLVRADRVRETAFGEICELIGTTLELPVLAGTPRSMVAVL